MSFSSDVKEELLGRTAEKRHCQLAELAAILSGAGRIRPQSDRLVVEMATEHRQLAEKYVRLLEAVTGRGARVEKEPNKTSCFVAVTEEEDVYHLLQRLKVVGTDSTIRENMTLTDGLLLQRSCCKRAFLRGAYLTAGSMSDPKKSYHFEIVCEEEKKAQQLKELMNSFDLDAKIARRKQHRIVYLKEGSRIVDALNIMGAHDALMNLENVRILKEMRNDINRRVNCETANINKTVNAAYRQQEAIRYLQSRGALGELPAQLQEIAELRMEYPEATIQELGTYCMPTVGKSGVNHRLRRLEEIAERMGYVRKEE